MNWRDAKKKRPEVGQIVACLVCHWKRNIQSVQMYIGEFYGSREPERTCYVENRDDIGEGSVMLRWVDDYEAEYDIWSYDVVEYWMPVEELNIPKGILESS